MNLNTLLSNTPGIGPNFGRRLQNLNLFTIKDLIYHFPFRYDDFSNISTTVDAQIGAKVTLIGEIWSIKNIYTRSRKIITQAIFNDGKSPITLTWFNSSWLIKQIAVGDKLQISGKLTKYKNKLSIVAPIWEKMTSETSPPEPIGIDSRFRGNDNMIHTGRLVPVYPETFGLTSKWLRTKISQILPRFLDQIEDPLPNSIKGDMEDLPKALNKIHFPQNWEDVQKSKQRLGFDELFYISLATQKTRLEWQTKPSVTKYQIPTIKYREFIKGLPFKLTKAQKKVLDEIIEDLEKGVPMNRLVQGEVGSGKTVVAAVVIYLSHLNGYKSLYMAPTEILAFQHHLTLTQLLKPYGIQVEIYTGSRKFTKINDKRLTIKEEKDPKSSPDIIVGTHALLSEKLYPENVGLVIVDEQQRFGVQQRSMLRSKAKIPHFLTMTATPIPRTVALTLYGDLDLSVISELPKGRIPVKTFVVPSKKRPDAYEFLRKKIKRGDDQVYIITPLIEESETLQSAKAAKVEFERLKKEIFPDLKLGLLHGKLKSKEKEAVINSFKEHKIDILVSTSVVEVGVDVGNATIMMIEGAERFGLSQLHQLRGRVGRGDKESFCFLFTSTEDKEAQNRLKNLERTSSGLKLAELDLKIRGSGEIFGKKQSGRFELKIASFSDLSLIEKTREAAKKILQDNPTLDKYPLLAAQLHSQTSNVMPD
jgi:ATP-dependent DNA helicase RecG